MRTDSVRTWKLFVLGFLFFPLTGLALELDLSPQGPPAQTLEGEQAQTTLSEFKNLSRLSSHRRISEKNLEQYESTISGFLKARYRPIGEPIFSIVRLPAGSFLFMYKQAFSNGEGRLVPYVRIRGPFETQCRGECVPYDVQFTESSVEWAKPPFEKGGNSSAGGVNPEQPN